MSFERCRVVVFETKNPAHILPYLYGRMIHYYFQVTLNDYEREEGWDLTLATCGDAVERNAALHSDTSESLVD